jgi:prepilin-type N-terminal cleavage/methylation domain-containing protein
MTTMIGRYLHTEKGFTLVELIISAVVVSIMVISSVELFSANLQSMALGKARATGIALANEKMEYLRDLPYDSLATQHGEIVPAGSILDDEYLTRNGIKYHVHTIIQYVDDPYDGNLDGTISGKPTDLYPYDYKQAEIEISLVNGGYSVASLSTNIGAKAAETSSNTGILRLKVLDANGLPVEDATARIINSTLSPAVDITTTTDSKGFVIIPKLPPDSGNDYSIVITKPGYSTDRTYSDPSGSQTAVLLNPNILVQQITDITFGIDQTANIGIDIVDTSGNPIANVNATITGSKKKYANPDVFKYSQASTSDSNGHIALSGIEWDGYNIALSGGYYIVNTLPYQAVAVNPGGSTNIKIVATNNAGYTRVSSVSPVSDDAVGTTVVTIKGANFTTGTTVKLVKSGQPDIVSSSTSISGGNTITANLNLTGVTSGSWDVVVTNGAGNVATQVGGFSVTP